MAPGTQNGRARVVITGLGAVTPLGNDVETSWKNLIAGKSGAAPIVQWDASAYPVTFACELKEFEPRTWIDHRARRAASTLRADDRGCSAAGRDGFGTRG